MKKLLLILVIVMAASAMHSCSSLKANSPQGFAVYEQSLGEQSLRAVSPEGVTWQVSLVEQEESANLDFWRSAVRRKMQEGGYKIIDSLSYKQQGNEGFAWEMGAPFGSKDYLYLVAVQIEGKKVRITEAAGAQKHYKKHREALIQALQK